MKKSPTARPLILIILDGWGYRESQEANAIASAHKPNWDALWAQYPHTMIEGSGCAVGLPDGQMGNSEVGHMTMGAGRVVYQDLTRIDLAIKEGDFFKNEVFLKALDQAKKTQKAVHVMGLVSPGGVHSHVKHIKAFIDLAAQQKVEKCYVHAFLDGRDTPPKSALKSLHLLDTHLKSIPDGRIVSLVGRYYAMDRDKRWERIEQAYNLVVSGEGAYRASSAENALEAAYSRGETDEFVKPTVIQAVDQPDVTIEPGDIVIFMNFRSDRARELTRALTDPDFTEFKRKVWPELGGFVSLCRYDKRFKTEVAFPPLSLHNILSETLSAHGLKQLRIAETEKYAHVTFFFNGGVEQPYPLEERILIPSSKVATYDLHPEMSAFELTDRLIEEIKKETYDVIICNFANADMVGHTGDFAATQKAIETIDTCLGKITKVALPLGGEILITADHGNAELMFDSEHNQPHTAHTSELVPLIYIGRLAHFIKHDGRLSDIAPTMLHLLGLSKPIEMTGSSLIALG